MAIDTVTKRKSVINDGIPAISLLPPPDALIEAIDRRRLADFYSLGIQLIPRNFWVPDRRDVSVSWSGDTRSSRPDWVQDQDGDGEWLEDSRIPLE